MPKKFAIIGLGQAGLGGLLGFAELAESGQLSPADFEEIHVFDEAAILGAGLPYNPSMTDPEHILNGEIGHFFPYTQEFTDWINSIVTSGDDKKIANREKISNHFKKIFEDRLKEKFLKFFGVEYKEENRPQYQDVQKELCEDYDNIWQGFQRRYLNIGEEDLKKMQEFYPRTLAGMFAIMKFEEAVQTLEHKGFKIVRHPKTTVTSVTKSADQKLVIEFNNEKLEVDNAAISESAIAKKRMIWQSDRYIESIWPIAGTKSKIAKIIAEEIAKRKEAGNENKEITIVIEGKRLSAVDVVKTIFQDGVLTQNQDGSLSFAPSQYNDYKVKVIMMSRSPTMHKVMEKHALFKTDFFTSLSQEAKDAHGLLRNIPYPISYIEFAKKQGGEMRIWQAAILMARSAENIYKLAEIYAGNKNDEEGVRVAKERAAIARKYLYTIISHIKKDVIATSTLAQRDECDEFLDNLKGDIISQAEEIQKFFNLTKENSVNYKEIFQLFKRFLGYEEGVDQWAQMKKELHEIEHGDVAGLTIWQHFKNYPFFTNFLSKDEKEIYYNNFPLYGEILDGMPITSAKELLAFHEAEVLQLATMGKDVKKFYLDKKGEKVANTDRIKFLDQLQESGKSEEAVRSAIGDERIIFENPQGKQITCDIAINAMRQEYKKSHLLSSLESQGVRLERTKQVLYCSEEEFAQKKKEWINHYGEEQAEFVANRFKKGEDGKFYEVSTESLLKDGKFVDENNTPLMPNLLVLRSGNIFGAVKNGKETMIKNLGRQNPQANAAQASARPAQQTIVQQQNPDM